MTKLDSFLATNGKLIAFSGPHSPRMLKASKNVVGEQLRKLRVMKDLSQSQFASLCRGNGWKITREIVARIEGRVRCVADFELLLLADNLEVDVSQLLPPSPVWNENKNTYLQGGLEAS